MKKVEARKFNKSEHLQEQMRELFRQSYIKQLSESVRRGMAVVKARKCLEDCAKRYAQVVNLHCKE
jgi:hypothetical protein